MLYGSDKSFEISCRIAGKKGDSFSAPYETYRKFGHGFLFAADAEGSLSLIRALVCCSVDVSFCPPTSELSLYPSRPGGPEAVSEWDGK